MAKETRTKNPAKGANSREDRLKAALKANMARRKAQARARNTSNATDEAGPQGSNTKESS